MRENPLRGLSAGFVLLISIISVGWLEFTQPEDGMKPNRPVLRVSSPAFEEGGMIPPKYTCDGANVSPPLRWSGCPEKTESLAIIVDDVDNPRKEWTHWLIFNLPQRSTGIQENIQPGNMVLFNNALQGVNNYIKVGYSGPCPDYGIHRYAFEVYALDQSLMLESGATKSHLLNVMKGHVLASGMLMGRYERKKASK